jgi:hypothetical protein
MGTVDVRKGTELEPESSLKLWEWSDVSARYRLGAQVRSQSLAGSLSAALVLPANAFHLSSFEMHVLRAASAGVGFLHKPTYSPGVVGHCL